MAWLGRDPVPKNPGWELARAGPRRPSPQDSVLVHRPQLFPWLPTAGTLHSLTLAGLV